MRKHIQALGIFGLVLTLTACSGSMGTGKEPSVSPTPPATERPEGQKPPIDTNTPSLPEIPTQPEIAPSAMQRIDKALNSGNPAFMEPQDEKDLLQQAIYEASHLQNLQMTALYDIYAEGIDLRMSFTNNSISIYPRQATVAFPFLVANNGNVLASASLQDKGRALAYGQDVFELFKDGERKTQHQALFNRAMNWLITGSATKVPSTLKYARLGYDTAFKTYFAERGIQATEINCNLNDVNNSCWQEADLIIFGYSTKADAARETQVKNYQKNGKAIFYMHHTWTDSAGGRQVVHGLGMELGGYPGNYFQGGDGLSISGRTLADTFKRTNQFGDLHSTLKMLADENLVHDFSADPVPANVITKYMNELSAMQGNGINIFASEYSKIYRLLVLWADLERVGVIYNQPEMRVSGNANKFLRTYASDSFLVFNRQHTKINAEGAGDYMPKAAQLMQVSTEPETIKVTIAQDGGVTAIGRGAIPGGAVKIEVVDADDINYLSVQTSHLRTYGNPLKDNYERPRHPQSFTIPLNKQGSIDFITPFGGPLFLRYSGAAQGKVVTLKITGAVRYSHFDFTQPMSDEEKAYAISALEQGEFGWQTLKFVGGEIQQTLYYARSAMGKRTPEEYVVGDLQNQLFKSNHIAMGFNNEKMSASGISTCTTLNWDCTGSVHNAPSVQHFIGWLAACGFLCSGNPSDGAAGLAVGWGWTHELGHNTVQRIFSILSCQGECNNNVLASASMVRLFATTGRNQSPNLDYPDLYNRLSQSLATGKTGVSLQEEMKKKLWDSGVDQNSLRPVFFELGYLYSKYRLNMTKPTTETTLEFMSLLNIGTRLVDRTVTDKFSDADKDRYAIRAFTKASDVNNTDLLYVLSSKIIGQDMQDVFYMYGLPITDKALSSVQALNLPKAARKFYALPINGNDTANGQWLDIGSTAPAWPL